MDVWIVEGCTPYEGAETVAVFLDKGKAEAYAKACNAGTECKGKIWERYEAFQMPVNDSPAYECWAVQYLREDGTPAGRVEYGTTEAVAMRYAKRSQANGIRCRVFRMMECPGTSVGFMQPED